MRRVAIVALLGTLSALFAVPSSAVSRAGHFGGSARTELLRLETIRPVIPAAVDGAIGVADAMVATVGLEEDGTSAARATNADAVFFGAGGGSGPTVAEQRAGNDNPTPAEQASPRVVAGVVEVGTGAARAHARAVDALDGVCPEPDAAGVRTVSLASSELTDVRGAGLIDIRSSGDGAGDADALVTLHPVHDTGGLAVQATASSRVATIEIADTYALHIVGEPALVARATGRPGGATLHYTAPVIEVEDLSTGESLGRLDAAEQGMELPGDPVLGSFVNITLGGLHDVIALEDGTYAGADADLVRIRFTDFAGAYEQFDLRVATLSASATAPTGGVTSCGGSSSAPSTDLPHAIVYSGWRTFEHLSIEPGARAIADLANQTGAFTVSFTDEATFLRPEVLEQTDLIIWNNATGTIPWTDEQKALFVRWLLCGGGTVGIHSAADANHSWPEYTELMGARFASHPHVGYWPNVGDATIQVEDQTHPATAPWHGMSSFRMPDEFYLFVQDPRGTQDVNVLLSLDETSTYPWIQANPPLPSPFGGRYPADQPLAWTKTFRGAGRVFYTNLGHNPYTFARADFLEHLRNGIGWVAGVRPDPSCLTSS